MALTWNENTRKDQGGNVVSQSYRAQVPGWGEASVHPHIHHPGEMFLDCHALGIEMHSLGQTAPEDALKPAETELVRMLIQYVTWCAEALNAIYKEDTSSDI